MNPNRFSWILFTLDLVQSYTDKLLGFLRVQVCYERDSMKSVFDNNQADIIEALTQSLDI